MLERTISYYNENAESFAENTLNLRSEMEAFYQMLRRHIKPGAHILDLGCGSGRDSKYFMDNGYTVEAVDGSPALCEIAGRYINQPVRNILFNDLDYINTFDAVWANASLLHVPKNDLPSVFKKIHAALKDGGVFYASFKYGDFEGERHGRHFTDMNERRLNEVVESDNIFKIVEILVSNDTRPEKSEEKWLNAVMIKQNY